MTCGCKRASGSGPNVRITASAICALFGGACAFLRDGKRAYPPRWCNVDQHGIVTRAGVRWYGCPYPLRVLLWLKYRDRWSWAKVRKLPGCGCVVVLKDRWNGVREWAANYASQSDLFSS